MRNKKGQGKGMTFGQARIKGKKKGERERILAKLQERQRREKEKDHPRAKYSGGLLIALFLSPNA